jgi:hypothetical protein
VLPIDKPLDPAQLVIGWHQIVHTDHLDLPRLLTGPDRERRKSHTSQPRDQTGRNFNRLLAAGRQGLEHGDRAGKPTGRQARLVEEIDDLTRALGEAHVELRALKRGGPASMGFR